MHVRGSTDVGNGFVKLSRLYNEAPIYLDRETGYALKYIIKHEEHDYSTDGMGRWAIISELGIADIKCLCATATPPSDYGHHPVRNGKYAIMTEITS